MKPEKICINCNYHRMPCFGIELNWCSNSKSEFYREEVTHDNKCDEYYFIKTKKKETK